MVARRLHLDVSDPDAPYPDAGEGHAGAIGTRSGREIVVGLPDGTFGPGQAVARHQAASMLMRAMPRLDPEDTSRLSRRHPDRMAVG